MYAQLYPPAKLPRWIKSRVEAALSGATDVLWITDKRGRELGVPAAKIAYVEVGSADGDRRIGFGG